MTPLSDAAHQEVANAIRALSIDAVNAAKSGHPGAPMGLANIASVLFAEVLRYDPDDSTWPDRDRFVLSNGHASMLLYACLHLSGQGLSMDEIKRFRQLHSKTPGHPEYGITRGVETTTGPLGQGFANAVGMALGRRLMHARLEAKAGFHPLSHYVYGICGDGCLMEGISSEAASLAGHLGLGELIFIYDDNGISIDGETKLAFTEDVEARFRAMGWHTARLDGHNPAAIRKALEDAKSELTRPSLLLARTEIGFGSPNRAGKAKAHGEPLGEEEATITKAALGWDHAPFEVPDSAYEAFRPQAESGRAAHAAWKASLQTWLEHPDCRSVWEKHRENPRVDLKALLSFMPEGKQATRALSGKALNFLASADPRLVGGSADLTGSNKSKIENSSAIHRSDFRGRNLFFGVREHAMAAAVNGLALYGGFVPYGATFLTFSDYMKNSIRLSALMKIRALQIFTHDSIGLGEDGPTHQPIEHLWALRMIPGLTVWRPADAVETAMAWAYAAGEGPDAPHALVFSRQGVDPLTRDSGFEPSQVWDGAYVLERVAGASVTLIATGTEVELAVASAEELKARGISSEVVSMPSVERFLELDQNARSAIVPPERPAVTIEAGSTLGWKSVIDAERVLCLGVDRFGESAPAPKVYEYLGLTAGSIAGRVVEFLSLS